MNYPFPQGDFLQDVAADDQPVASAAVIDSTLKTQDTTVNGLVFPKEVLENIFCRLGLVDLYASTRRVCRLWNSIITAEVSTRIALYVSDDCVATLYQYGVCLCSFKAVALAGSADVI